MERDECRRDVVARSNGGYSKSFEITPMNRVRVRSYIVILNMCLSCTVIDIFSVEYCRDLEIWVRGRSSLLKTDCPRNICTVSYSESTATSFSIFSRFDTIHERDGHLASHTTIAEVSIQFRPQINTNEGAVRNLNL